MCLQRNYKDNQQKDINIIGSIIENIATRRTNDIIKTALNPQSTFIGNKKIIGNVSEKNIEHTCR